MLWLSVSLEEMYKYGDIHQQEAAIRGVLLEQLFLEISQKFTENICQSLFLIKLQASGLKLVTLLRKRL